MSHLRKAKNLDRNRESSVKCNNQDQKNLRSAYIRGIKNRIPANQVRNTDLQSEMLSNVQIPEQEERTKRESNANEYPIQHGNRTPRNNSNGNPHEVCIAVQRPAFKQVRTLAAKPFQRGPQPNRYDARVAVNQASGAAEQREVVRVVALAGVRELPVDGAREEQDHDDGGGDPERPVQVWVAFEGVEEVGARVQRCPASLDHFGCVHVEVLCVEADGPEVAFRGAGAASLAGAKEAA